MSDSGHMINLNLSKAFIGFIRFKHCLDVKFDAVLALKQYLLLEEACNLIHG
jgi:hypothetical protein